MIVSIGAVVPAAGGSNRMGSAKQLLRHRGRSLVRHAAEAVVDAGCRPVAVVLGAHEAMVGPELAGLPLSLVPNPSWGSGLGSSIRVGVREVAREGSVEAVILMLGDQPLAGPDLVSALVDRFRRGRPPIVASDYGVTSGVPALFARAAFPGLLAPPDHEGAKRLILAAGGTAAFVPFPGGLVDIDTPEDYNRLIASDEGYRLENENAHWRRSRSIDDTPTPERARRQPIGGMP